MALDCQGRAVALAHDPDRRRAGLGVGLGLADAQPHEGQPHRSARVAVDADVGQVGAQRDRGQATGLEGLEAGQLGLALLGLRGLAHVLDQPGAADAEDQRHHDGGGHDHPNQVLHAPTFSESA